MTKLWAVFSVEIMPTKFPLHKLSQLPALVAAEDSSHFFGSLKYRRILRHTITDQTEVLAVFTAVLR